MEKEWEQHTEGKVCEFIYNKKKCEETEIYGMTRCKCFCKTHFDTVRKDNVRLFNKDQDIPEELVFTKKLDTAATFSRFKGHITISEREELENGN